MPGSGSVTLGDAVLQFLAWQSSKNNPAFQQELQRLMRWYGKDRDLTGLSPWEMESFGESSGADSLAKLAPVKAFLSYAYKQGITSINLGNHLKVKRTPARHRRARRAPPPTIARLSVDGHQRVQADLESLKEQRLVVAEDIRHAMADKDFRENAPLDAARDQQAHLEARIRDLEHTLSSAVVVSGEALMADGAQTSRLGSRVVVNEIEAGEEIGYTLVDPTEVDLAQGKISVDSPAGRAFLNRIAGEVVKVEAPGGAIQYRIERVEG